MTLDERLLAIEQIKALKARYFRHLDTKDWRGFASVFTASATLEVRESAQAAPTRSETGADVIVAWVRGVFEEASSIHHGHMPEITIESADRASGIWAMDDIVIWPDRSVHGWGHYHERYAREAGEWKIASSRLVRLRVERRSQPR